MRLFFSVALRHLSARRRQSIVSLAGIVIGVAFFLAISSMMQGSEKDFITRLVDNAPHITISDNYRTATRQPLDILYPDGIIEIRNVKPQTETRGIRGYRRALEYIETFPGARAAPVLKGQALLSYAGRDVSLVLNGMSPADIENLTTLGDDIVRGSLNDLAADRNGILVGEALLERLSLNFGNTIHLVTAEGERRSFKVVATFHTSQSEFNETQVFADLKPVQALMNRPDRINSIIIRLDDESKARNIAAQIENRIGYRSVSWQEAHEDLLNTLVIRNVIMYTVVGAVLLVAAFGIYNTISTIVLEKQRDIGILKSMGFRSGDIKTIFVIEGMLLGLAGIALGLPAGSLLMVGLGQLVFHPPGMDPLQLPMDWGVMQFVIAGAFALVAALLAAWLPARKGAQVMPVDILRGGQ
ncbi:MAG: ABC transporter permease [Micavibrio sp.]|nr:MAG: ABC transporter permease [Micavibrio sp.]